MRINLKTFWRLTLVLTAVGVFLGLSTMTELRVLGLVLMLLGIFWNLQIEKERKRQRRRRAFYHRVGRLIVRQSQESWEVPLPYFPD